MVQETAVQKNRIEKFLQQCGFKISSFISDICGLSGMTIIEHLYTYGKISPEEIVNMLHGKVRNKTAESQQAVNGTMSKHQQEFLKILVEWYKQCENHVSVIKHRHNKAIEVSCNSQSMFCKIVWNLSYSGKYCHSYYVLTKVFRFMKAFCNEIAHYNNSYSSNKLCYCVKDRCIYPPHGSYKPYMVNKHRYDGYDL